MLDLAATFEQNAVEAAAMVWRCRRTPLAVRNAVALATADAGVTGAFAGVASTGSVCVSMGRPLVAATSLLMPLNIVLLAKERIIARPRDLFDPDCLKGEGLKRDLVFITGPSATADMGPLVHGVHGPHRLVVLLLE
jgi:L-lactate dehydrogenase complex protein LldG